MIEPDKFLRYKAKAAELVALALRTNAAADYRTRNLILNHIDAEVALNGSGEQTEEWVGWLKKNNLLFIGR